MIEPPPLSRIAGAQCFMPSIAPVRLTAMVRFHASRVVSTRPWRAIVPALLTRMWSPPKRASAAATTSFQDPSSAQEQDLATVAGETLCDALARRRIDIGQNHRRLLAQEQLRFSRALPTRRAGDQRHLSRQPCHFLTLRFVILPEIA